MQTAAIQGAEMIPVAQAPDALAVEKFNQIMASSEIRPENQIVQAEFPSRIPFADRLGEAFQIAQIRQYDLYAELESMAKSSATGMLPMTELMKLQYQVANLAFQQDLVTKVIDRGSQAIQTLFKNQ